MDPTPKKPIGAVVDKLRGVAAEEQRRFDQPQRRSTLQGMPAQRLPEHQAPTVRTPTPADGLAVGRIANASEAPRSAEQGQLAALLAERDKLRAEKAELERQKRATAEASVQSWPPAVTPAPKPVAVVVEPDSSAVIAWLVKRAVANRAAIMALVAALGIGGGATAIKQATDKPGPSDAALVQAIAEQGREAALTRKQLNGILDREAASTAYLDCLAAQYAEHFEQLLPAPDKQRSAALPRPWLDRCKGRKP